MTKRSRPISGCASSTRPKPALFEMLSSSANVYASPVGVVASIIMLNAAAVEGETRSGLGTSSKIARRRPASCLQCGMHLTHESDASGRIEMVQKIRDQHEIVPAAKFGFEGAAGKQ